MKQANKYTLVTGGSEGIGYELTKVFAENNHHLILVARSESDLNAAKGMLESYHVDVITIVKDLFEPNAAFELYDDIKSSALEVDILVNVTATNLKTDSKAADTMKKKQEPIKK